MTPLGSLDPGQTYEQYLEEYFPGVPVSEWTRTDKPSTQALRRYETYGEAGLTAFERENIDAWQEQQAEIDAAARAARRAEEEAAAGAARVQAEGKAWRAMKDKLNEQEMRLWLSGSEIYQTPSDFDKPDPQLDQEREINVVEMGFGSLIPGIISGLVGMFTGSELLEGATSAALSASQSKFPGMMADEEPGGNGMANGTALMNTGMYGIGGPGVQEPANGTWSKRWNIVVNSQKDNATYRIYFWKMWDGYTLMYNPLTGGWKRYKPRKNIVLSSDPRLSNISRAVRATEGKLKRLAKKSKRLQYKA
jgi:hypothetical protein